MGAQGHKLTYFSKKGCVIDCNSVVFYFCLDIFKSIKRRTFETSSEVEKIKTGWRRSANLFMEILLSYSVCLNQEKEVITSAS